MAIQWIVIAALMAAAGNVHSVTKCHMGGKILYLNDTCPSGYTELTRNAGEDRVSIISKSPHVQEQETQFLRDREVDKLKVDARIASENRQLRTTDEKKKRQCEALEVRARHLEAQMRLVNPLPAMERLKHEHRMVRDDQFRMRCDR